MHTPAQAQPCIIHTSQPHIPSASTLIHRPSCAPPDRDKASACRCRQHCGNCGRSGEAPPQHRSWWCVCGSVRVCVCACARVRVCACVRVCMRVVAMAFAIASPLVQTRFEPLLVSQECKFWIKRQSLRHWLQSGRQSQRLQCPQRHRHHKHNGLQPSLLLAFLHHQHHNSSSNRSSNQHHHLLLHLHHQHHNSSRSRPKAQPTPSFRG